MRPSLRPLRQIRRTSTRQTLQNCYAYRKSLRSGYRLTTPHSYLQNIIHALSTNYDAVSAMCLFLEFVLPRVPKEFITKSEATKTMEIVVKALHATSDSTLVECLACLLELCDLDNWESIKLGVEAFIYYSSHTRLEVFNCSSYSKLLRS